MSFSPFPQTDLQSNASPLPFLVPTSLHVALVPSLSLWVRWEVAHEVGLVHSRFFSADPCHPLILILLWVIHGLQSLQGPPWQRDPPCRCVALALPPAACLPCVISPNFGSHSSKVLLSLYHPNLFSSWHMKSFFQIRLCLFSLSHCRLSTLAWRFFFHITGGLQISFSVSFSRWKC